ncbi:hypothetical protein TNCV_4617861 [Trichonephila clavipes]|nr:hypothetical protein TNCV_4617861 [Trichonephila clavipes]
MIFFILILIYHSPTQATFPFSNFNINIRAANQTPVHFSPLSNHKEPTQLLQDELFPTSTFNKPHLSPTSQRKPGCFTSSRTLTLPGAINFYNMGWRLAPRAICPATNSDKSKISCQIWKWNMESVAKSENCSCNKLPNVEVVYGMRVAKSINRIPNYPNQDNGIKF